MVHRYRGRSSRRSNTKTTGFEWQHLEFGSQIIGFKRKRGACSAHIGTMGVAGAGGDVIQNWGF
jgi:hypothetical protein